MTILCSFSAGGIGGTLSIEVLGVDRLSRELRGKLLVEEFAVLKLVRLIRTLCGLCLIFCRVEALLDGLGGLFEDDTGLGFSISGTLIADCSGLTDLMLLSFMACESPDSPLSSVAFLVFLLGDGDLDEAIHDLRANVTNDSDTVFVLSRAFLGIAGTGGISLGIGLSSSDGSNLSGDPFICCIQDLGRFHEFRLLMSFGRSSFEAGFGTTPSATVIPPSFPFAYVGDGSAEATR